MKGRAEVLAWAVGVGIAWMVLTGAVVGDQVASKAAEAREHYERGEYEDALRLYREAQIREPGSPALHFNVGDALYKLGDLAAALEEFEKASLGDGEKGVKGRAFYNLGKTYFQQGRFSEAAEAFKQVLELDWKDRLAKLHLELALEQLEDRQEGQEDRQDGQRDRQDGQRDRQDGQRDRQDGQRDRQDGQEDRQDQQEGQQDQQQRDQGEQMHQPEGQRGDPGPEEGLDEGSDASLPLRQEEAERLLEALEDREKLALLRLLKGAQSAPGQGLVGCGCKNRSERR